jgi:hypothetical protein
MLLETIGAAVATVVVVFLLQWIFHPAMVALQNDAPGTKPDTFFIKKKQQRTEFSQQIYSPSSCDLTLVIPAYNEVSYPQVHVLILLNSLRKVVCPSC